MISLEGCLDSKPSRKERCIACGKPVLTEREGKIHDECYTKEAMFELGIIDYDDD